MNQKSNFILFHKYIMTYKPTPTERARVLRKNMTEEEKRLWEKLRARRFHGLKFLRQHPITYEIVKNERRYYVPDFYCAEKKVIIEVDGIIHNYQKEKDTRREELLKEMGFSILRIKNEEFVNIYAVLEKIKSFIL
ncbi:endonuclease domain-containing protein [Prolixibacteraceae bacterium Z1-6]|uniref:Endonuclease domain-containing protein n=1 Tax=Draconibacterium aestuarii TaxID=2998507 RepID=A0A9X3FH76_9BACT|nr:endonuclease domain-containing protein [Prolixibacteraceae bacterium Z1-6]